MNTIEDNTFSDKLNRLFEVSRRPDGTKYSQKEVVESAPGILTRVYLWQLRKGKASRPTYRVVKALADFFGIQPSYFFESDQIEHEPAEKNEQQELSHQIALRSSDLDVESQKTVLLMIEAIRNSKTKNK